MVRWSRILMIGTCVAGLVALAPAEDADCRLIRGAATTQDAGDDVEVCAATGYLHQGSVPVGNLAPTLEEPVPTWDAEAPTSPVPASYGHFLGSLGGDAPDTWPTFEGTFTGHLDTMKMTMYVSNATYSTFPLIWYLEIDGVRLAAYNPGAGSEKRVPMVFAQRGVDRMDFALVGIHQLFEQFDFLESGEDVEHTIRIGMAALYYGDGNSAFWFDSVDFPSQIEFNADVSREPLLTTYDVLGG